MYLSRIKYLILLLLSFLCCSQVQAIVTPTTDFYVNDYANVLNEETESYILNKSVALNSVDGTQIVVVTVPTLEGKSLEEYSLEIARTFKIGDASKDNGLLLFLSLEERAFRVEVGDGLEGILPDGKTGRFQDEYIIPYLKEDKFNEGIKNGYDVFFNEIVTQNNLDLETTEARKKSATTLSIEYLILAGTIGFIVGMYLKIFERREITGTKTYLILWAVLFIISFQFYEIYRFYLFTNIIMFIIGRLSSLTYIGSSRDSYYRSSGSMGSFRGGGGSFSGGGSSRHF